MIGIVGGIGPYAGIDLIRKVFDHTIAEMDQEHLDVALLSHSSSIPDRTAFLLGKVKENPGPAIAKVLKSLEAVGATIAGIPCNTAHAEPIYRAMLEDLEKAGSRIRVIHMIRETVAFISEHHPDIRKVGIMSTTGTRLSRVYVNELVANGYEAINPSEEIQIELIHDAIFHPDFGIKSKSNPVQPRAIEQLMEGFRYLKGKEAEAVILGCTEFTIPFSEKSISGMIAIDPTTVLARALIKAIAPDKLKPYHPFED